MTSCNPKVSSRTMRGRKHRRIILVSAAAVLLIAAIATLGASPVTALPKAGGGGSKTSATSTPVSQPTATASSTSTSLPSSTVTPQSTGSSSSSSIKPAKIKPSKSSAARSADVGAFFVVPALLAVLAHCRPDRVLGLLAAPGTHQLDHYGRSIVVNSDAQLHVHGD